MSYDCVCDYEPAEVYSASRIKCARKDHKCDECFRRIARGESYESVWAIWEGEPTTFKTCCRCLALREFVQQNVKCFCWAHGNMIEDAMGCADEYYEQGNGLLFGAYRRKILIERGTA